MVDADYFESILDERPQDWPLRLVYADYLEEIGQADMARAQRWMAEHRRCPTYDGGRKMLEWAKPYNWVWNMEHHGCSPIYASSELNIEIFNELQPIGTGRGSGFHEQESGYFYRAYTSRRQAEIALGAALCLMRTEKTTLSSN